MTRGGRKETWMKPFGVVPGVIALIVASVASPPPGGAQTAPQTPSKPPAQTPTKPAPAKPPAAKAPAKPVTPAATEPARTSLVELRRDVETRKAEVTKLQEAPLPGDDEMKKHREAKATLEEQLQQHEVRIKEAAPKLPAWQKERSDLKALPKPTRKETARIQELDIVIAEAERIAAEARGDAAGVKAKIREVDGEIAKVESRRSGSRRSQEEAERALRRSEEALAAEEKRARAYLALYDVTLRARTFDTTMKAPKPPFEKASYEQVTAKKRKEQVEQEKKAVENGKYSYDAAGIRKALQTDGAKFFATAKQAANQKPLAQPAAKATPVRSAAVKDIDAAQKAWTQALGKGPEATELTPLLDRVQTALWTMK
jgi:chromosome segregation ATPase